MPKKKKNLTEQNKKWKPVLVKVHSLQNFLSTGVSLIIVIFSKQQIIIMARDVKSTLMLKLFILKYFTIVNAWLELNVAKKKKIIDGQIYSILYCLIPTAGWHKKIHSYCLILYSMTCLTTHILCLKKKKCILSNDLFNNTHSVFEKKLMYPVNFFSS